MLGASYLHSFMLSGLLRPLVIEVTPLPPPTFFSITLEPRVERYKKVCEPSIRVRPGVGMVYQQVNLSIELSNC